MYHGELTYDLRPSSTMADKNFQFIAPSVWRLIVSSPINLIPTPANLRYFRTRLIGGPNWEY